jgi:DnaJ-class molecular chaperone
MIPSDPAQEEGPTQIYEILESEKGATQAEARKAHRMQMLKRYMDKNRDSLPEAIQRFVNDPHKRTIYLTQSPKTSPNGSGQ